MEQIAHLGHQVLCPGALDGLARHQDRIARAIVTGRHLAPSSSQDPSSPVPLDGTSHSAPRDERDVAGPGREEQYHPPAVQWPRLLQEPTHLVRPHRSAVRGGQPRSPLASTRGEDRPSGSGAHAKPEAVPTRTPTIVRLVRPLAFGHRPETPRTSTRKPALGRPGRVYGPVSALAKGLDNRKCVKTPATTCAVEKRCAIVPPLYPGDRTEGRSSDDTSPPRCFPPMLKGSVDSHGTSVV